MIGIDFIFKIFGGLALFLFGLHILSTNLKKCAGDRLKQWLQKLTGKAYRGALLGGSLTSIIQSSSITMVTVLGLINAGLLSLRQAIGVMLGAEVGTTVTAQLVAFEIGYYYFPLIIVGFILFFFSKNKFVKYLGKTVLGFGILFLGMQTMSMGVEPLKSYSAFTNILTSLGRNPILGILVGAIFTSIVQSSSATIGLTIAMGMEGVITLPVAIAIMLGANMGTCITALIASVKSSLSAKRAAISQLTVNVIGVGLFLLFLSPFTELVATTSANLARQIANAHAIFNVSLTLAFLPAVGLLVTISKKVVPGRVIKVEQGIKHLDEKTLNTPSVALSQARKETERMAQIALSMINLAREAWSLENNEKQLKTIFKKEEAVDEIEKKIDDFLIKISSGGTSFKQSQEISFLKHCIVDIERVADQANNIAEFIQEKKSRNINFSKQADESLMEMTDCALQSYGTAVEALEKDDEEKAQQVLEAERRSNQLEQRYKSDHYDRLEEGTCNPEAAPIFVAMLSNLERISDHAENISEGIMMGF